MAYAFITDDDIPLPAAVEPEVPIVQAPVIASLSSLQVAKGEELAMERWHRLNRPQCEFWPITWHHLGWFMPRSSAVGRAARRVHL